MKYTNEFSKGSIVRVGKGLYIVAQSRIQHERPSVILMSTTASNCSTHMNAKEKIKCQICEGTGYHLVDYDEEYLPVWDKRKSCEKCNGEKEIRNPLYIDNIEYVADCMQDFIMMKMKELFFGQKGVC
jgi:hypothetical protein